MTLFQIIVLALLQGVTEFLPISSSAHLILVPALTGWRDQGLIVDVAVHVGTLLAVILYFRMDLWRMLTGLARFFSGRGSPERAAAAAGLAGRLVVGTIPLVAAGFFLQSYVQGAWRAAEVIAWATLLFGLLLYAADQIGLTVRRIQHMPYVHALLIGVFQALALIPGTSRSGITMTAARLLGYEREEAARFSLLLAIPAIVGAGLLLGYDLYKLGDVELTREAAAAAVLAFVSALAAIAGMMAWLRRMSFTPFVVYRVALGVGLLIWIYGFGGAPLSGAPAG